MNAIAEAGRKAEHGRPLENVSVIIIALGGGAAADRCRDAMAAGGAECIVALPDGSLGAAATAPADPAFVPVPLRRMRAVEAASRPYVAIIEDTVRPDPDWGSNIVSSLSQPDVAAIGGPVEIASDLHPASYALALRDFGRFQRHRIEMQGEVAALTTSLPGANMAFRRDLLIAAMDPKDGLVEQHVCARLVAQGYKMMLEPSMAVTYCRGHAAGEKLPNRFQHGWIYASRSLSGASSAGRTAAAAKALLLPFVLTFRSWRDYRSSHNRPGSILLWLALQNLSWSLGELAGALTNRSRNLDHWK